MDEMVVMPRQNRAEGLDQEPGRQLVGDQGQAQQRRPLPGDGRLDRVAVVGEGDPAVHVQRLQPRPRAIGPMSDCRGRRAAIPNAAA